MRGKIRNSIASYLKLPQFTTMNVIDGQAGLVIYSSLIFYSLTINNILNIIVLLILAGVAINLAIGERGIFNQSKIAVQEYSQKQAEEENTINDAYNLMLGLNYSRGDNQVTQNINSANNYSTSEDIAIGTWIDGETIYQRTVSLGTLSTGANDYSHNIPNVDEIIDVKIKSLRNDGKQFGFSSIYHDFAWQVGYMYGDTNKLTIYVGTAYTGQYTLTNAYATVQYTRTTNNMSTQQ